MNVLLLQLYYVGVSRIRGSMNEWRGWRSRRGYLGGCTKTRRANHEACGGRHGVALSVGRRSRRRMMKEVVRIVYNDRWCCCCSCSRSRAQGDEATLDGLELLPHCVELRTIHLEAHELVGVGRELQIPGKAQRAGGSQSGSAHTHARTHAQHAHAPHSTAQHAPHSTLARSLECDHHEQYVRRLLLCRS